jgi:hypothetical protein
MSAEYVQYEKLVDGFRQLTSMRRPSGRCCAVTHGPERTPECCWQVIQGARLYFTDLERLLLAETMSFPAVSMWQYEGLGTWDLDREFSSPEQIGNWLREGWLARTLESASHPTRPVIGAAHRVIGVVAVPDCNTGIARDFYRSHHAELIELWQQAVDAYGLKPYYIAHDLRNDLVVL